jgi:hypothetical protein
MFSLEKKNKGGFWIRKYIFLLLFKSFNFLLMLILIVLGFFYKKNMLLKKNVIMTKNYIDKKIKF